MKKSEPVHRNPRSVAPRSGLGQIRANKGFTQATLAEATDLSTDTIQRIEAAPPQPVSPDSLKTYGNKLGLDWEDLVAVRPAKPVLRTVPKNEVGSWMIYSSGPWMTAANGLQWKLHELRHKHVRGRKARGKLYDLQQHLAWQTLDDIKHWLTRHAEISDLIKDFSPHVGCNIDCCLDESRPQHWWVIDEWIDGPSLEESLNGHQLDNTTALEVMLEVAKVLQVLHRENLIYRSLAPRSIYLASSGTLVSDFEMTKIIEGGRTVAPTGKWPESDVFIAPELRSRDKVTPAVDFYSWAMILAYALTGQKPLGPVQAKEMLTRCKLPPQIATFAIACLGPKNRPQSFDPILALGHRVRHKSPEHHT